MKRNRITPYNVFILRKNGSRERIEAHDLIVELRPGVEVQLNLAPHPAFAGQLTMYAAPTRHMKRLYDAGLVDDFATFFGGANVLHVGVERHLRAVSPSKKKKKKKTK